MKMTVSPTASAARRHLSSVHPDERAEAVVGMQPELVGTGDVDAERDPDVEADVARGALVADRVVGELGGGGDGAVAVPDHAGGGDLNALRELAEGGGVAAAGGAAADGGGGHAVVALGGVVVNAAEDHWMLSVSVLASSCT